MADRETARQEIRSRISCKDYLTKSKGSRMYVCPFCNSGTGPDGTGALKLYDTNTWYCHKCDKSGDVIDLYQRATGTDYNKALRDLAQQIGITIDENRPATIPQARRNAPAEGTDTTPTEKHAEGLTEAAESKPDFMADIKAWKEHITDPAAQAYLAFRGISEATAARYWMGYDPTTGFIIIPCSRSFYIARNTDAAAELRYKNPTGASIELFNVAALWNDGGRPVFITEGAIDALSVIEAGGVAVGLNSSSNTRKLLTELDTRRTDNVLVLCLDTDEAGKGATVKLVDGLKERNIAFITADICSGHKDPNEALTADRTAFAAAVGAAERVASKPDNTADYITRSMGAEIDKLKEQATCKTGFANLDAEAGSIYAGLYAVGGISSVGKTTFIAQLADQMAAQGQHVLFFSMEQSRLEMVSKSISRLTAKAAPDKAVSSLQIRTGARGTSITAAAKEYLQTVGDRVSIVEGNFNCNVAFIGEYARQYIAHNGGVRPVVIVDYLQVLQPIKDPETGRKATDPRQIVDYNVTQLKRISRALEIPVFVISSVNRSNYLAPIDFESFKESGGIEYTADVVWGLQLAAIHDPLFEKEKDIVKKRAKIAEAKEAMPREIELVCLKNRYGKSRYACEFTYYPQYDYFAERRGGFTETTGTTPWDTPTRRK